MESNEILMELDANMDISCVAELRQILAAALAQSQPIVIAADAVERMDTAGVQLLYSFFSHAKDLSEDISLRGVSDGMKDAFHVAGLESWLAGHIT